MGCNNNTPAHGLSPRFLSFVEATLRFEGAWSDDDRDPGGATMWGLTERFNPEIGDKIRSRTLTKTEALEVINSKYYEPLALINQVHESIAFLVFDSKFHGMVEVVKELQVLIERHTNKRVIADGIWGKNTASAALLLSDHDVLMILKELSQKTFDLGSHAALRVIRYQKNNNMPVYDYTVGFANRQDKRLNQAKTYLA